MPENDSPAADTPKTPRIPRPPSREELEEISEAQSMITDDWTGEGGKPAGKPSGKPDNTDRPDHDQKR
ncbi:MAG TPA: hypothetical protein VEX87_15520 [Skermanella sp.]|jgi:hypothetical protein|nr:hypothetical protein [Skermanella sp.]